MTRGGVFPMKHPETRGFTLLELIVVLIIIGVGSALVIPRLMGGMGSLGVRTTAGKIAAVLRYAGSRAVSRKIEYTAVFDLDHNRLVLEFVDDRKAVENEDVAEEISAARPERVYDLPRKIFFKKVTIENNGMPEEALEAGIFRMTFYPNGGSTGGVVCLADDRDKRYIIRVDRITGSVKIMRGEN